jgi:hypothetical protein
MRNAPPFDHFDLEVLDSTGEIQIYRDVKSYSVDQREVLHIHSESGPVANYSSRGWISARVVDNLHETLARVEVRR